MCDINEVHKYIEKLLGRPVWTHEIANPNIQEEIHNKSKEAFLQLCGRTEDGKTIGFRDTATEETE
jgi:hypothetical protein